MWVNEGKSVLTCNAIVIWDGLTKPDVKDDGTKTWNLRVAIPANSPELVELEALRQIGLKNSKKPNVTVANPGNNPVGDIEAAKFPELPGYKCFSASTTLGAPEVFNLDGAVLNPMTYGPQIYNGTVVRLLLDSYAYDNKQRGINFGLQGVQIIDATAPRLAIGAAGISTDAARAAFTGSAPAPVAATGTVTADFPPEGWLAHPSAPGHFYKGQEVLTEAALRAKYPPAPPVSVQAPPPPPQQQQSHQPPPPPPPPHTGYMDAGTPPPPPAAAFPPAGWWPHPGAPGSFYNAANEVLTEELLRARVGA